MCKVDIIYLLDIYVGKIRGKLLCVCKGCIDMGVRVL